MGINEPDSEHIERDRGLGQILLCDQSQDLKIVFVLHTEFPSSESPILAPMTNSASEQIKCS